MDHNHLIRQTLIMIFGPSWMKQPVTTKTAPLPSTPEYEIKFFTATPLSVQQKLKLEKDLGWTYRTILGIWLFVAHQTRIDILPSVTLLSQFQNAPGKEHYDAVKAIGKWLRCYPDLPLTFKRKKKARLQKEINHVDISFEERCEKEVRAIGSPVTGCLAPGGTVANSPMNGLQASLS